MLLRAPIQTVKTFGRYKKAGEHIMARQKRIIAEEHIAQEYSKHRENKKQESDISIDTDSYEL